MPTSWNWIVAYVFFGLFCLASLVNLVCGFFEWEKPRKISKPFCLGFLSIAAAFAMPTHPFIFIGALCGFVGDILLIWKSNKFCLGLGCLSFLVGHAFYITQMMFLYGDNGLLGWPVWMWMIVYFVALEIVMIPAMMAFTRKSKVFTIVGIFYSTILITVGCCAAFGCFKGFSDYLYLVIIGDLFFIISDSILSLTVFRRDIKRRDFWIMITYLAGEALIVSGLVFTFVLH
jgi:uncharacterized membrane protein YhhN